MPKPRFKRVYLVMGIPLSGKTHYVNQFRKWTVISADDIKKELYGNEWPWYANHGTFQELLKQFRRALYAPGVYTNRIYLDYPFTNPASRKEIYRIIKQARKSNNIRTRVILVIMDTPLSVCLERNKNRDIPIAEKVIRRKYKRNLVLTEESKECPYIKGKFFIYEEFYPDMPDWFIHRIHRHFDGCHKAMEEYAKGGGEDALLVVRPDLAESSICDIPSSDTDNPNHAVLLLAALLDSQKQDKNSDFLKRIREKASVHSWRQLVGIALQLGKNLGGKGGG